MAEDRPYLPYEFRTPRMDKSRPTTQVAPGTYGRLSGVDGRFDGGLKKYYGNNEVVDFDDVTGMGDIDLYSGPTLVEHVTFQKRGTSTIYRGFIVRWDSQNSTTNQQIDLIYSSDNGSTWTKLVVWAAGNSITSDTEVDVVVSGAYLLVAVDTLALKTVFWDGSALSVVTSGPGAFSAELAATTENTTTIDTSFQLNGTGSYQMAWRFFSSTRGIFSSLSAPLTIRLDHFQTSKATGSVQLSSAGGDSGLLLDGDLITINGRVYEADDDSSITGDITIDISAASTIAQHCQAIADAINGDSSRIVDAVSASPTVYLTAIARGAVGNAYTLTKTETGGNTTDISVSGATFSSGGQQTREAEKRVSATLDFPAHGSVVAGSDFDDFDPLFDTIDVFRTINLGDGASSNGAIFYLEQTIAKAGNWATSGAFDSLQVVIGTLVDEALPFQTQYDPERDIVVSPPASGTIGRYESQTYMADAASASNGGYDTIFSSSLHASPEYFSTFNRRKGDAQDGRPLRFLAAGQSLFQLSYNAILHIFKSGKIRPIQIVRLHQKIGLVSKYAAHSSGNSIFMICGFGLAVLNGDDGSLGGITAADRVIFEDWKSTIATIVSCYDARLNASFFLNPSREEMLVLWHSSRTISFLDGANFVWCTTGPEISDGTVDRAHFITATGLVVEPDVVETGTGTMWGLATGTTLNGTTITGGTTLTDGGATFHADMIGTPCYLTSGDNAGTYRIISAVNVGSGILTFSSNFASTIATGDRYAISPIPFSARAWRMQTENLSGFVRWKVMGAAIKSQNHSGFGSNDNVFWRVSCYRNGSTTLPVPVAYPAVDENPSDSAETLSLSGISLEPYIEQIASGVKFELTDLELAVHLTDSREDTD